METGTVARAKRCCDAALRVRRRAVEERAFGEEQNLADRRCAPCRVQSCHAAPDDEKATANPFRHAPINSDRISCATAVYCTLHPGYAYPDPFAIVIHAAVFALHLALQSAGASSQQPKPVVRDSTTGERPGGRAPIRKPVTDALRASAFHDAEARDLFGRARAARLRQDSSLQSYDAKVRQRLSVTAAVGSVALERLAYRQEIAARVQWQRDIGAHIDVTGGRITIPPIGIPKYERETLEQSVMDKDMIPVPYYPGYE